MILSFYFRTELAKVRQIKSMRAQVLSAKKVREATKTSSMKKVATSTGFDSQLYTSGKALEVSEEVDIRASSFSTNDQHVDSGAVFFLDLNLSTKKNVCPLILEPSKLQYQPLGHLIRKFKKA